jgi:tRNA-splicing ligase RtcB
MEIISDRLYNWASILDPLTRAQAIMTSEMPFIYPHLALMPDAHLGKGATVGSVIPTLHAIIPAAVGVDIGCGMIAVRTQFLKNDFLEFGKLVDLRQSIENAVPLSAGKNNRELTSTALARTNQLADLATTFEPEKYLSHWRLQLGTLGSGNHFIEVTVDEEDKVWLFLHSGSRGIGNRIAQHHIKVAQEVTEKNKITLPHKDLAYLIEGTPEFDAYITELQWAQKFALLYREEMIDRVMQCVANWGNVLVVETEKVNCHHNFTQKETHYGEEVWLSRKGAIEATQGKVGLIPGSMGTASYVVTGKGNDLSLNSSPHGAGRNHSRTAARRLFTQDDLRHAMVGIEYRDTDAFLDEHPDAYKPIDQVMADSADLVEIWRTLHQIVNVKGD